MSKINSRGAKSGRGAKAAKTPLKVSNGSTIPALFAKQNISKPASPKTVACPVCSVSVALSLINKHLDSGCGGEVEIEDQKGMESKTDECGGGGVTGGGGSRGETTPLGSQMGPIFTNLKRRKVSEGGNLFSTKRIKLKATENATMAMGSATTVTSETKPVIPDSHSSPFSRVSAVSHLSGISGIAMPSSKLVTNPFATPTKTKGDQAPQGWSEIRSSVSSPSRVLSPSFTSPTAPANTSAKKPSFMSSPSRRLLFALDGEDERKAHNLHKDDGEKASGECQFSPSVHLKAKGVKTGANRLAKEFLTSPDASSQRDHNLQKTPSKALKLLAESDVVVAKSFESPGRSRYFSPSPHRSKLYSPSSDAPPSHTRSPIAPSFSPISSRASPLKLNSIRLPSQMKSPLFASPERLKETPTKGTPFKLGATVMTSKVRETPSRSGESPSKSESTIRGLAGTPSFRSLPTTPNRKKDTGTTESIGPTSPRRVTSPGSAFKGQSSPVISQSPRSASRGGQTSGSTSKVSTSPKSPKSPFHDRGHYWNRRQVSAENVDKSVSVARKLWGTEEGEKPDKAADGKEAGTATVALWKPYYLENFKLVLKAIKANANDWRLFSTSDKKCFHHFLPNDDDDFDDDGSDDDEELKLFDVDANGRMTQNGTSIATLSEQAQLLFVRLFQRKHRWLRRDQIKYEAINEDLGDALKELVSANLVVASDDSSLKELPDVLDLLLAPDLKTLAKDCRVNLSKTGSSKGVATKSEILSALLNHGSRQRSILDFTLLKSKAKVTSANCSPASQLPNSSLSASPNASSQRFPSTPSNVSSTPSANSASTLSSSASSSPFSTPSSTSSSTSLSKNSKLLLVKAKALLGTAYKVATEPRETFLRAMLLFDMCGFWMSVLQESASSSRGGNELFKILLVNTGKLVYPTYVVSRRAEVFQDRQDLVDWQDAVLVEQELRSAVDGSQWSEALEIFRRRELWCRQMIKNNRIVDHAASLPVFLRRYTPGWSAIHILSLGVDLLERNKDFEAAVELLTTLLAQRVFCPGSRGKWFDRLTLNLQHHLKLPTESWEKTLEGLEDQSVKAGRRLSIWMRAEKLAAMKSQNFDLEAISESNRMKILPSSERTIEGTLVPGMTGVYLSKTPSTPPFSTTPHKTPPSKSTTPAKLRKDGFEAVRVEELTLRYYKEELGYVDGLHCEGSIFSALFLLLFWDVIFMDGIPDVFWNPFQTMPLDFLTPDFYSNREKEIEERLEWISAEPVQHLVGLIRTRWETHEGTMATGINWERFETPETLVGLVESMDSKAGKILSAICGRLVQNYRHMRSGMPDLCLWNRDDKKWILVEVKGPNDKLSTKQILWLDFFILEEIPCEVCHVTAISSKKLKSASTKTQGTTTPSRGTPRKSGRTRTPAKTKGTPMKSALSGTPFKSATKSPSKSKIDRSTD